VAIRVVRLGAARQPGEGVRLGTVRWLPRGVKRAEYAARGFFDVWYPELAPSAALMRWLQAQSSLDAAWTAFARKYRREMQQQPARRTIDLLAALSRQANFSVGCYCEDEARCHRSLLRDLLREAGGTIG
jgi:uncharacterized protein YeaO (DUF488 family)